MSIHAQCQSLKFLGLGSGSIISVSLIDVTNTGMNFILCFFFVGFFELCEMFVCFSKKSLLPSKSLCTPVLGPSNGPGQIPIDREPALRWWTFL